jgi:hypothetical protein
MTLIGSRIAPVGTGADVMVESDLSTHHRGRTLWFRPDSAVPVVLGVLLALAGLGLIALGWAKVAGLADVSEQMPYVISAGLTGLSLVMGGLLLVNISTRRQDAAERARQMEQLREVLLERHWDEV